MKIRINQLCYSFIIIFCSYNCGYHPVYETSRQENKLVKIKFISKINQPQINNCINQNIAILSGYVKNIKKIELTLKDVKTEPQYIISKEQDYFPLEQNYKLTGTLLLFDSNDNIYKNYEINESSSAIYSDDSNMRKLNYEKNYEIICKNVITKIEKLLLQ